MKIYVLGSNSFVNHMVESKNLLCELGQEGHIHPDYESHVRGEKLAFTESINPGDDAEHRRKNDYFRAHYKNILESDAILVINNEKKGVKNYIGGNVLIEMGQAFVNDKKIFLLNDTPMNLSYSDEIIAMDPICLHGDLENIKKYTK